MPQNPYASPYASSSPVDSAIKVIEAKIGFPSDQNNLPSEYTEVIKLYSPHKDSLIQWGVIQGLNKKALTKSSIPTLAKIYSIPRYRAAVLKSEKLKPGAKPNIEVNLDIEEETNSTNPTNETNETTSSNEVSSDINYDEVIRLIKTQTTPLWNQLENTRREYLRDETKQQTFQDKIIDAVGHKLEADISEQKEKFETDLNEFKSQVASETQTAIPQLIQTTLEKLLPRELIIKKPHTTLTLAAEPRHRIFDEALTWLESSEHLYLVGPAGTGKTHLGKQLAQATELEFLPMPQALTKYELSGYLDGSGIYRGTIFRQAVEFGGLLVMDEIDINGASAVAFANSVLANGYCAFPDATIPAHPNLKVMACANTFGRGATKEYIGRNPLDAATLDRFAYLICDYDEDMERQIFGTTPWVAYVQRVRSAVQDLKLQHIISMRAIARGKRGLNAGLSLEKVLFSSLWRGLDKDQISKILNLAGEFQIKEEISQEQSEVAENSFYDPDAIPFSHNEFYNQFIQHINNKEKISAVKILRQAQQELYNTQLGLREAVNYVNDILSGFKPQPAYLYQLEDESV